MRTASVVVLAALALTGRAAGGEEIGVLAVAPPPGPGPELVETTTELRRMLSERAPDVLDAQRLRERMTGEPPGASLAELDLAYESARAAFVKSDYEGSIRTLRTIVEELERLPDGEAVYEQWTRAMLRLAKAEQELGRTAETQNVLDRLVRAEPKVEVDPALYPPDFARLVKRAKVRLALSPVRRLTVSSHGRDVRVFVSGREVGKVDGGPLAVMLPAGRYRVSGAQGDLRAPALHVDLGRHDQSVALEFSVAGSLRPGAGPGLAIADRDPARALMAAGGCLRLGTLVAVRFVEQRGASYVLASVYDVRRGRLDHEGRVRLVDHEIPAGRSAALAAFLLTKQEQPGVEVRKGGDGDWAPPLIDVATSDEIDAPRSKSLGWVAFGTGIATLVAGGVTGWQAISSSGNYDKARKLLGADGAEPIGPERAQYDDHLAAGDGAKRNAIIAGVGAGTCAIATGIMAYIAYRQTGEIGPFRF